MIRSYWHIAIVDEHGHARLRLYPSFGALEYTDAERLARHCLDCGRRHVGVVRAI